MVSKNVVGYPPSKLRRVLSTYVLCAIAIATGCDRTSPDFAERMFVHEVYPLLQEKCIACHGGDPEEIEGDFDIRSLAGMLAGGESGLPAIVPGHPDQSPLFKAVTWEDSNLEMPPKENDRLSAEQVALIRSWIADGASWPEAERFRELALTTWDYSDGIQVKTSGGLTQQWSSRRYKSEDLWAFQPVEEVAIPRGFFNLRHDLHPIDAFVNEKMSDAGLKPTVQADRRTLIRRATFDLTGLPPTPEEIAAFLSDPSENAFENVVDRLLASPHYGEQWGRHWLDVVRYADTNGYSNDYERPNAWRYRDYVIRAFNDDKPYDQFIKEQLAGDELDPENPELLIATGFLRMGPWEHTGMSVSAETRQLFLDDVTNSVGETFLSIPLRCASCHDHKFDPIPTRDYYRIQSVFAPVQFAERPAPYLPIENVDGFESGLAEVQKRLDHTRAERKKITEKEEVAARHWMESRGIKYLPRKERNGLPDNKKPPRFYGLSFQDLGYQKVLNKHSQLLSREMDRYEPLAYAVFNGSVIENRGSNRRMEMPADPGDQVQQIYILAGGSIHAPADSVVPGVLSAIGSLSHHRADAISEQSKERVFKTAAHDVVTAEVPVIAQEIHGRRLAFAEWLTKPEHPITARSMVNRIWQHHFGNGIAGNANNFGVMGKKPTHPDLLDWLASKFVEEGWSIKSMHRLIMTSDAYQRASQHPAFEKIEAVDPNNALLTYFNPRRLSAEEMRDAMLKISGELNLTMGGLPVKPEINMEVALQPRHLMGSVSPAYQPSRTPAERNRRTVYAYRYRGLPDPLLEVFNQPTADVSCERRTSSTVTPQVFTLFNGQNTADRALAMASRLMQEAPSRKARIAQAIQEGWGREATAEEIARADVYIDKMVAYHVEHFQEPPLYPVEIERKMFEEMTGEPFTYTERLDVYESYIADLKPWEVDEETRALADFCRVIFNANEFVYVY